MAWAEYHLVFRLRSPLHVGWRTLGNLQTTRPYVPGKLLWAALTARITRNQAMGYQPDAYKTVGDLLKTNMRFGYLYPATGDPLQAHYYWEDAPRFEYDLMGSYVSTALNYEQHNALDGSLHETEFVAPYNRQGEAVFLAGILWVQDSFTNQGWQQALQTIWLGGERRYGWGRLTLESNLVPLASPTLPNPDDFLWEKAACAHIRADERQPAPLTGPLEPLIGWEMQPNARSGKQLSSQVSFAYLPGSQPQQALRLRIGEYGVWELHP